MIPLLFALLILGPYHAASNFSADLLGPRDTREATWGNAEAVVKTITFNPPSGYRVRILRVSGDLIAWPRVLDEEPPVRPGKYAGVLLGIQTTDPEGSARCDLCADNTLLYVQGAIDAEPLTRTFDQEIADGLLGPDHKLVLKVAAWLNTTGRHIHVEPTLNLTYRFEKEPSRVPTDFPK